MRRVAAIFVIFFHLALLASAKHGESETESEDKPQSTPPPSPSPSPQTSTVTVSSLATVFSTVTAPPPPVQSLSPLPTPSPGPSQSQPPAQSAQEPSSPLTSPDGVKETATLTQPLGPSGTSTRSSAPPANTFQFSQPPNMTTCTPAVLTWAFFSSQSIPVTIVVTNERATSPSDTNSALFSPRQTMTALVTRTLSTSVQASACVVSWPKVNVPAGTYNVIAFDAAHTTNLFVQSPNFVVTDGSDTSCVTGSDGLIPGLGGGSTGETGSLRSGRNLSTGALAGTIVGVIVAVGGLIAAFTLPGVIRRAALKRSTRRPGAPYHLF